MPQQPYTPQRQDYRPQQPYQPQQTQQMRPVRQVQQTQQAQQASQAYRAPQAHQAWQQPSYGQQPYGQQPHNPQQQFKYPQQPYYAPSSQQPRYSRQPQQPQRPAPKKGRGCGCGCLTVVLIAAALVAVCLFLPVGPVLEQLGLSGIVNDARDALSIPQKTEHTLSSQESIRIDQQLRGSYVYDQLNEQDQEKYRIMLDAFETREQREYPYEGTEDLGRIRGYVVADHPELFYVNGVYAHTTTTNYVVTMTEVTLIEGNYRYDAQTTAQLQAQLDARAAECLAGLPADADDYAKAKYLYEYIAQNVEYDWGAYDVASVADGTTLDDGASVGQTAVDALVGGSAVCAGYSSAFQYLALRIGLPCVYVTGIARGDAHAWNAVQLDGAFYFVDATWGDPQFVREDGGLSDVARTNYDYLNITTDDLLVDHTIDEGSVVPLCTSMADNYYVREGAYLESADLMAAGSVIQDARLNGQGSVQFRMADRASFDQMVSMLFEEGRIYQFLASESCWYSTNPDFCSITVIF